MNFKWIELGIKLVPVVIGAVQAVEGLFGAKKGKEKQDAAVDFTKVVITAVEGLAGKDLMDDASVQAAVRELIDAAVAVQNAVAKAKALRG